MLPIGATVQKINPHRFVAFTGSVSKHIDTDHVLVRVTQEGLSSHRKNELVVTRSQDLNRVTGSWSADMSYVHIISATAVTVGCNRHMIAMCGGLLDDYERSSESNPVGNYLSKTSPVLDTVTCLDCRTNFLS